MKLFKYRSRILISSKIISFILRNAPKYKKRVFNNLSLIYPEMSDFEKVFIRAEPVGKSKTQFSTYFAFLLPGT